MSEVLTSQVQARPVARDGVAAVVWRVAPVLLQLLLALAVVHLYAIEGPAFARVFLLATVGFAVHALLPLASRLPFFVGLSVVGGLVVFGARDAAWLYGCGLVLIGLCHVPAPWWGRVALLSVVGAGLAFARAGMVPVPWSAAVWPILGSMFMFRLVLYLYALDKEKPKDAERRGLWTLGYFFMLPNLVFPLFPVIDYQTFKRTYFDRDEAGIYGQGLLWITRGLVHLLLYRVVYHAVLNDPADVVMLSDLVQFMLGTFLLYLRVSGQFHLIVGVLHLFGFRLPETHRLYYLAHSFTELWRRINIYWTDFMMKIVFYPAYFRVKKLGPVNALVVATSAVFVTTWLLHSYQWFWLRGGFPLTPQDTLFWGILGGLVIYGAVRELKAPKKAKPRSGWNWRQGVKAATTFLTFCFLWSLWSTESVTQWVWMLGAAIRVDVQGVALLLTATLIVFGLGSRDTSGSAKPAPPLVPAYVRTGGMLVLLLILASPAAHTAAPPLVATAIDAAKRTGLNTRDAAIQHRGYYEQLDVREQIAADAVLDVVGKRDAAWQDVSQIGVIRSRQDLLLRDLWPSKSVLWNGNRFSTNRWGMRDRDYEKAKAPGTYRIALLGPSHVMGNGVGDGETFEALLEERLNRERTTPTIQRYEVLNFGVDGFAMPQQIAMLEARALEFDPDMIIATHYHRGRYMTERYIVKLVWGGVEVRDADLARMLQSAGLYQIDRGRIPVPFGAGRRLARSVGLDPRMPSGESDARARSIAGDVLAWSLRRYESLAKQHGATAVVLGLNAVIEDAPDVTPDRGLIEAAGLPLIDLTTVYPAERRARLRVAPWDDHPNAEGHRLVAEKLYPALLPYLGGHGQPASRPSTD